MSGFEIDVFLDICVWSSATVAISGSGIVDWPPGPRSLILIDARNPRRLQRRAERFVVGI